MTTVFDDLRDPRNAIVDVRSPAEYAKGHIPGAVNIPLFSNDERAHVGTLYVKEGQQRAFDEGLRYVGPRMHELVERARALERPLIVYCWRGGMRSSSVAWLYSAAGLQTRIVPRGYKGFKAWAREIIAQPWKYHVIGGMTGAGKTDYLHELAMRGEQVLDLEALANHKGSSFGSMGQQPTTEQVHNDIAMYLASCDPTREIFVEDESRTIGTVHLPEELFVAMQSSTMTILETSRSERIARLVRDYGDVSSDVLLAAFTRIERKLGGERYKRACAAIAEGDLATAADLALSYYDATYTYCHTQRTTSNT
jgi:tRNA 2-selenouridine synthase